MRRSWPARVIFVIEGGSVMRKTIGAMGLATATLWASGAWADWGALNMPRGVTETSRTVYDLHMLIFWICVAIAVVVFGAMFWSILHHRKSKGAVAAHFHESTAVEIAWTIVPFVILIAMAIPATKTLIAMEDTRDADITIKVTAYQWKWQYEYLDDGVAFFSNLDAKSNATRQLGAGTDPDSVENYLLDVDKPLVIPVGKKVRFLLTASDVIHAWWVPDLAVKKDAIPGFVNEAWTRVDEPGTYRGQCAELCGKDHGFMPIVVVAKPEAEYRAWLDGQKATTAVAKADDQRSDFALDELMARGKAVYDANCAACHQADGQGVPGVFPAIAGSAVAQGDLTAHVATVLDGRDGTAMKPFAGQLGDAEIAAVVTYQRNAFGNATGDMVQPAVIAAAR